MRSYQDALDLYKARLARNTLNRGVKLENNTYLVWADPEPGTDPKWFGVLLHGTIVVKYQANEDIELNSGGWHTRTTINRMHAYTPVRWIVRQQDYCWFVINGERAHWSKWSDVQVPFKDRMTLHPDGTTCYWGDNRRDV